MQVKGLCNVFLFIFCELIKLYLCEIVYNPPVEFHITIQNGKFNLKVRGKFRAREWN